MALASLDESRGNHATIEVGSGMRQTGPVGIYLLALILFVGAARLPAGGAVATLISLTSMGFAGIVFLMHLAPNLSSGVCLLVFGTAFGLTCGRVLLVVFDLCLGPSFLAAALALGVSAHDCASAPLTQSTCSASMECGRAARVELDIRSELGHPPGDDRSVLGRRASHGARIRVRALLRLGLF